jgi:chemotaxis protein CheD
MRVAERLSGAMSEITIGIADLQLSNDPDALLVTYALGSCIAVTAWDPVRKIAGMIHYMLPQSSSAPEKAIQKPAMFADTGVPLLFERMYAQGCNKQGLIIKVAGGGKLYEDNGTFEIGKRNYTILRKMFWKVGVTVTAEDVGGAKSRTLRLFVGTGRLIVSSMGVETDL